MEGTIGITTNILPPSTDPSIPSPQPQVKRERVERDTPAPKRPSNAFLLFCQEQREAATAHHLHQTGRVPDKKQLTRQLASRWNALPEDDKKVSVLFMLLLYYC